MSALRYRKARSSDIPAMARMRAARWGDEEYWQARIAGYMEGTHHPRQARKPRVLYVAEEDVLVGLIAGHLTRRYGCDGELEWIDVVPERRGSDVATELLRRLAKWFAGRKAARVCVDVEPTNTVARRFYQRHGAEVLNPHWLVWSDIKAVLASDNP